MSSCLVFLSQKFASSELWILVLNLIKCWYQKYPKKKNTASFLMIKASLVLNIMLVFLYQRTIYNTRKSLYNFLFFFWRKKIDFIIAFMFIFDWFCRFGFKIVEHGKDVLSVPARVLLKAVTAPSTNNKQLDLRFPTIVSISMAFSGTKLHVWRLRPMASRVSRKKSTTVLAWRHQRFPLWCPLSFYQRVAAMKSPQPGLNRLSINITISSSFLRIQHQELVMPNQLT